MKPDRDRPVPVGGQMNLRPADQLMVIELSS